MNAQKTTVIRAAMNLGCTVNHFVQKVTGRPVRPKDLKGMREAVERAEKVLEERAAKHPRLSRKRPELPKMRQRFRRPIRVAQAR